MCKNIMRFGAAVAMLLLSFGAHAQWTGSISYSHISLDDDEISVDLGAIVGSAGYRLEVADRFFLVPEVRVGFGVSDDRFDFEDFNVKAEIDRLWGASTRLQYEFDTGPYLFGVASYVNYKLKASGAGFSVSDDSWESGFGAGAGFMFTPLVGGELSYERVDGEDLFTAGLRFNF
jgi:opacity protein-like surface antigen